MNLDVFELSQLVNVPISTANVILTHRILDQVHILKYFDRTALWYNYDFTELAENVSLVNLAYCRIINFFLVKFEEFMGFTWDKCFTLGRLNSGCHF